MLSDLDRGILIGILIGEGSFGGDGKQPQVTVRMHVRHERLFRWLTDRLPRSRLYGPYTHGGRSYFQWMARGDALSVELMPILEDVLTPELDAHAFERFDAMRTRYASALTANGR